MTRLAVALLLLTISLAPGARSQPIDRPGSSDHPAVSRYAGSVLIAFDEQDYDEYELVLDIWDRTGRKWTNSQRVEGKVSRRSYMAPEGTTLLEAYRNFEQAIQAAGLKVLFSCKAPDCGVGTTMSSSLSNGMPERLKPSDHYHNFASIKDFAYIAAEGEHQGKRIWLAVGMGVKAAGGIRYRDANNRLGKVPTDRLVYFIDIIESAAMDTGMVRVTADALKQGIDRDGKVTLDGILFDTDKAIVKPESKAALDAIAGYLKANAAMNFFVTGHTDATGSYDQNLQLSDARAKAVATALATQYGIAATRLAAVGVGPVSPAATNDTDEGRARNRRVELVKKPN